MLNLLLGIDIGTSSVKAVICNSEGLMITQAEMPNQLSSPQIGWSEESPEQWKENVVQTIRRCLAHPKIHAADIAAIGVSGMVPAVLLLDKEGNVLRPSIQQNDARAGKEIHEFEQKIGRDQIFQITGARLSAQSVGPKLAWLQKNEPSIWGQAKIICGSYDYINYIMTGSFFIEKNWALESGLYALKNQEWSELLLAEFDLDPKFFPTIREPTDVIAGISSSFAEQTGLKKNTPVIAGSADHIAAALAAGINREGDLLIKLGSAGDILYCSNSLILDERMFIDFHDIPGKYLLNGCMATSGSLLKWVVNQFFSAEKEFADMNHVDIYTYLDSKAGELQAGSDGLVILPYFLGEKTPIFDTNARGVIFGLTLSHNRLHIYRAVMEAVVFGFLHHIEVLNERGLPINRLIASEGGARSPLWRQIAADILSQPIQYLKDNPGSAYGAAILAGLGVGAISSWEKINGFIEIEDETAPDPIHQSVYQQNYRIYRAMYPKLKELF